jgi:hypothetical protein
MMTHAAAARSFTDHLIGSEQKRCRHGKPEAPGGLEVDDQLELGSLFNGQVAWFSRIAGRWYVGESSANRVR